MAHATPLPGREVTPEQQAKILGRAFETLVVSKHDIGAFDRANDLARALTGNSLSKEERLTYSAELESTLSDLSRIVPDEAFRAFFHGFQTYHDLIRFRAGEKAPHPYYEPNPDEAQPGKANFIAAALNPAPKGPGVRVDSAELPHMLERAINNRKIVPELALAITKANDAAEYLTSDYYGVAQGMAESMRATSDMIKAKTPEADTEAVLGLAKHYADVATRDRGLRPKQSHALDGALATVNRLMPGSKGKAFGAALLAHYDISRRDYLVEDNATLYIANNDYGKKRQPGAYLPLSIAKDGRAASR